MLRLPSVALGRPTAAAVFPYTLHVQDRLDARGRRSTEGSHNRGREPASACSSLQASAAVHRKRAKDRGVTAKPVARLAFTERSPEPATEALNLDEVMADLSGTKLV